jgi:hypothetical protein
MSTFLEVISSINTTLKPSNVKKHMRIEICLLINGTETWIIQDKTKIITAEITFMRGTEKNTCMSQKESEDILRN